MRLSHRGAPSDECVESICDPGVTFPHLKRPFHEPVLRPVANLWVDTATLVGRHLTVRGFFVGDVDYREKVVPVIREAARLVADGTVAVPSLPWRQGSAESGGSMLAGALLRPPPQNRDHPELEFSSSRMCLERGSLPVEKPRRQDLGSRRPSEAALGNALVQRLVTRSAAETFWSLSGMLKVYAWAAGDCIEAVVNSMTSRAVRMV